MDEFKLIMTASAGAYPRLGKGSMGEHLRAAWHLYDQSKISFQKVRQCEDVLAAEIIREQKCAGLDIVSDGLVRWYCPISHMIGAMRGIKPGALHHFLDTNFHVREAVAHTFPEWLEPIILDEARYAIKIAGGRQVKAVLTGPATLLYYTENKTAHRKEEIGIAYASILARELSLLEKELGSEGYIVQIDDPCLLCAENLLYFRELYHMFASTVSNIFLLLKTYGFPAARILRELAAFPVHCVGIDCANEPELWELLFKEKECFWGKSLALGVVSSRTKIIEDPACLAQLTEKLLTGIKDTIQSIILEPTSGLEFTARRYAYAKCQALAKTKALLLGEEIEEVSYEWARET